MRKVDLNATQDEAALADALAQADAADAVQRVAPAPVGSVGKAIQYLAGQCDGARTQDGHGFSRWDADFGHTLAAKVTQYGALTPKQFDYAKKLVNKYRKQLTEAGFNVPSLLAEVAPVQKVKQKPDGVMIRANIEANREKAYLVALIPSGIQCWLPKSQIETATDEDGSPVFIVPVWLAREKGILPMSQPTRARAEAHA